MPVTTDIDTAASPATWRRRKEQRQPEILSAARLLIEEHGAAATSMLRIAEAAGVSEATLYKYFDNKQDLVNRVLHDWALPFIERLTAELAYVSGVRSRLTLIAVRYLRSLEETPKLHRVFFQELRWANYRGSPLHRLNQTFAHSVVDTIMDGIATGEVRADVNPTMLRDMLFGGLEHIGLRTSLAGRTIDVDGEAAAYVELMLRGIVVRGDASTMPDELTRLAALIDRLERAAP